MSHDQTILDGIIKENGASIAADMSESEYFEVVVAEQSTKQYDLTYDQIIDGLVGGGGDGGIDAIYVFVNDSLMDEDTTSPDIRGGIRIHAVISQATRSEGFKEKAIDSFYAFSEDAFDFHSDPNTFFCSYNDAVLGKITLFHKLYKNYARRNPTLKISFFYGSRATDDPHANVVRKKDRLTSRVNELFSADVSEFMFLDAKRLLNLVRQQPKKTFDLKLAEVPIAPDGDSINLVGLVRLSDFFDFITDDNDQLRQNIFEANVRDYQTSSAINKQILDTLSEQNEDDFWWLNNGITILSTYVSMTFNSKVLNIDNPEIVNGLQTSQEIFNYFSRRLHEGDKDVNENDNRNLLVRVIVCEQEDSRNRIILATNSQNKIPIDALKSQEKIHRDIEDRLRRFDIFYDRRRNYWKLQGKPISRILTPMKLAQAVQAIALYDPKTAKEKPSLAFKAGNEERYGRIFSQDHHIDLYRFCAELLIRVEAILKAEGIETDLNQRAIGQIKFHALTHVVIRATGKTTAAPKEIAELNQSAITDEMLLYSANRVLRIFEPMGANNITSKKSEFMDAVLDDAQSMILES